VTVLTVVSRVVTLVTGDEAVGFGEGLQFLKELKDMHLIAATCPMAKNAETDQVYLCQVVQLVGQRENTGPRSQTRQRWQANISVDMSSLFLLTLTSPICTCNVQCFM